ncbi:MAG: type III secretion system chaperone [Alphaproteobacteria bacterium GM7ARS4]|nr:type III secretion system chaperone [Alphaproteobacteria bacterium GM7ARS4]
MLTMDMLVGDYQKRRTTPITTQPDPHGGYRFAPDDAPPFTCQRIGDALVLEGLLCAIDETDTTIPAIDFVQKLLRFNLAQQKEHTACLAYHEQSKQLVLYHTILLRHATSWQFIDSVDAFETALARWHDIILAHHP